MKTIQLLFSFSLFLSFSTLTAQEVPENLSDADKIYGLSKVWKEADKNFVFFDQVPDLDWNEAYKAHIPQVLATKSTYEYYKVLERFCALLNDGHTKVVVPWQLRNELEVRPPLVTEYMDGRVYITEIQNDTLKKLGLAVGQEVKAIDGIPVLEYAKEKVIPYANYSTEQDMLVQVYEYRLLRGPKSQMLKLTLANGKEIAVDRTLALDLASNEIFEFKELENNVGYLKISRFWGNDFNEQFDEIYPKIQSTSKLIIDVSENLGGNSGFAYYVVSHLVDKKFKSSRWKTPMYVPAYASWGQEVVSWIDNDSDVLEPVEAEKQYKNPVVVLISEKTYSAAEDFVSTFMNTDRGKIIGRATAGTTGNPIGFEMPGLGGLQICTKRDYLSDGKEFVGYGIEPEIFIAKSLDENHLINAGLKILGQ